MTSLNYLFTCKLNSHSVGCLITVQSSLLLPVMGIEKMIKKGSINVVHYELRTFLRWDPKLASFLSTIVCHKIIGS